MSAVLQTHTTQPPSEPPSQPSLTFNDLIRHAVEDEDLSFPQLEKRWDLWRDLVAAYWRETKFDIAEIVAEDRTVDAMIEAYSVGDWAELGRIVAHEMATYPAECIKNALSVERYEYEIRCAEGRADAWHDGYAEE